MGRQAKKNYTKIPKIGEESSQCFLEDLAFLPQYRPNLDI